MTSMKARIKSLIGPVNLGRLDFLTKPELKKVWGGAFNGQTFRRKMFAEIVERTEPKQIIETGAFRGNTTAFMAKTGVPVKTVEYDDRIYGYVSSRFRFSKNVEVMKNDSRAFLRSFIDNALVTKKPTFFYLDAHWNEDLPLAEELQIIHDHWLEAVIMIDDFNVPNTDYAYDDYGGSNVLDLEYLDSVQNISTPHVFFPSVSTDQESGAKRGSVVLTFSAQTASKLEHCETLVSRIDQAPSV